MSSVHGIAMGPRQNRSEGPRTMYPGPSMPIGAGRLQHSSSPRNMHGVGGQFQSGYRPSDRLGQTYHQRMCSQYPSNHHPTYAESSDDEELYRPRGSDIEDRELEDGNMYGSPYGMGMMSSSPREQMMRAQMMRGGLYSMDMGRGGYDPMMGRMGGGYGGASMYGGGGMYQPGYGGSMGMRAPMMGYGMGGGIGGYGGMSGYGPSMLGAGSMYGAGAMMGRPRSVMGGMSGMGGMGGLGGMGGMGMLNGPRMGYMGPPPRMGGLVESRSPSLTRAKSWSATGRLGY